MIPELITFDRISEPGSYICHWSGHLLRVSEEVRAISDAGQLILEAAETLFVTRLDGDPALPLDQARRLAKEKGINATF